MSLFSYSKQSEYTDSVISGTEGSVISQTFIVPTNANTISFSYNVVSEEPMEYVGSSYDDKFVARLLDMNGNILDELAREEVNTSTWYKIEDINFDGGDSTVYHTQWKNVSKNISQYRGKQLTIQFVTYDVGDSYYETATLVKRGSGYLTPEPLFKLIYLFLANSLASPLNSFLTFSVCIILIASIAHL